MFPASVEKIGEKAFYDNKLKKITFSSGSRLRIVGDCAFGLNDQLDQEKVRFPENAQVSESVFDTVPVEEHEEAEVEEECEEMYEEERCKESEPASLGE